MIEINEFIRLLEAEFEDVAPGTLTPELHYRTMDTFSSMHALIIIAFTDHQFDVLLTGQDLRQTNTIQELYNLIGEKIG